MRHGQRAHYKRLVTAAAVLVVIGAAAATARGGFDARDKDDKGERRRARNVIFFVGDGMGVSLLELAKARGMRAGVVSTAEITHATPAATYAHTNQRNNQTDIALQALPGDARYNTRLGRGLDVLMGGGRRHFLPTTAVDEEGDPGARTDSRDLRVEFRNKGYRYAWDQASFEALGPQDLPVLGLFERSHMEYEADRATDLGGEPSLKDMTVKAITLLAGGGKRNAPGNFLHGEAGRIDHAHHAGNAYRALTDAQAFD